MNTILCIPTLNAANTLAVLVKSIKKQKGVSFRTLIIDSDSDDGSAHISRMLGLDVHTIPRNSFNHGATRQLALSLCPDADVIVYMTQDAILGSPDSIKDILLHFKDERVGAVCGRQLPHADASPIAAHARVFNYTAESSIKTKDDISQIGIKTAFISNSFAAYRCTALIEVGGFPSDAIHGEDTYVAATMLKAGWKVAYSAEATCYHSHNYSIIEEFRRYFDIGVFHGRELWYLTFLGKADGEGKRFVTSEILYLLQRAPVLIPSAIVRNGLKLLGYKLGQHERDIPLWLKHKLSMNKGYWAITGDKD